jgi:hypothetical protein
MVNMVKMEKGRASWLRESGASLQTRTMGRETRLAAWATRAGATNIGG